MKFASIAVAHPLAALVALAPLLVSGLPEYPSLARRQQDDPNATFYIEPPGLSDLPTPESAARAAAQESLNLDDIQGDILVGMKKRTELFVFFHIDDPTSFKSQLKDIQPMISSTAQLIDDTRRPITAVNIAFSQAGLTALGVTDNLNDTLFSAGQFADAANLGDPGTGNWVSGLKGTNVHVVFIFASNDVINLTLQLAKVTLILASSASQVHTLTGTARPLLAEGHEHFGFLDGISQPAVKGFIETPLPGQAVIDPGIFLLGESGDTGIRPAWAKGGSFLAFRQLQQFVPEFNKFLSDNALSVPGLTRSQGADLLGARMVGRWKSGAPVDLAPLKDDPTLGGDATRNNDFTFAHAGFNISEDQSHCPFAAHVRKTRPRADLTPVNTLNSIMRSGIPYGPEVSILETTLQKTMSERGLAFVGYQSNISNGFHFIQQFWANNQIFIIGKNDTTPGFDPVIGANAGAPRTVSGLDPLNPTRDITMQDFIQSRGGEYFFSPPISAILGRLAV